MATGPQHYSGAEHDLANAYHHSTDPETRAFLVARAQVHATLALAAATIDVGQGKMMVDEVSGKWLDTVRS